MAKRAGMYKSEKRKKELNRQKKQEAKRQKRLEKGVQPEGQAEEGQSAAEEEQTQDLSGDQSQD